MVKITNRKIIKLLKEISLTESYKKHYVPSRENVCDNIESVTEYQNYFLNTKISNLTYDNRFSYDFFSPRYKTLLQEIFSKNKSSSLSDLKLLEEKNNLLQKLANAEFTWKKYHKKVIRSSFILKESPDNRLVESYDYFKTYMSNFITGDQMPDSQRKLQKIFLERTAISTQGLLSIAIKTQGIDVLLPLLDINKEKIKNIIQTSLDVDEIYDSLIKIAIKNAHEELISEGDQYFRDIGVSVSRVSIYYTFQKVFLLILFNILVSYAINKKFMRDKGAIETVQNTLEFFVLHKEHSFNATSFWGSHIDDCMTIISILEKSNIFTEKILKKKKNKSEIIYILPDFLEAQATDSLKMPFLVKPPKVTKENVNFLIKPLRYGTGSITKTEHLVKALNISSSKKFKVNIKFLMLCENLIFSDPEIDLDFFTNKDYEKAITRVNELKNILKFMDDSTIKAAKALKSTLSHKYDLSFKDFSAALTSVNNPKIQTNLYFEKKKADLMLSEVRNNLGFSHSRIFLARVLIDYPIYITDSLCIRLRLYPREHWLSRTSGIMKHLLYDFKETKLTLEGHINLLLAFYKGYPAIECKFKSFLISNTDSKKKNRQLLNKFFKYNLVDKLPDKKPLVFANYFIELYKETFQDDYSGTSINIEIDQSASALVFLSYVLRDKKMAEVCNVIGGQMTSPYDYIKDKFLDYYEKYKDEYPHDDEALRFVSDDRKLHKYAIMCFCYNQTHMGRMEDFRERWYSEKGTFPLVSQEKFLNKFAIDYPNFVDFVFPNATKKLKILNDVMLLMASETSQNEIKTLNGEVLRWTFFNKETTTRRFYDVVDKSFKSYKITKTSKENAINAHSMSIKFLSYFIHSIDSAIIRKIIVTMKENHNVTINHLHDCVLIHPNHVNKLYQEIKNIYLSTDLYDITNNLIFAHIESQLSPESCERLEKYKVDFYSLTDSYKDSLCKFEPENMYRFES